MQEERKTNPPRLLLLVLVLHAVTSVAHSEASFLEGAINVIPLGWSIVHEDGNPARLIVVKVYIGPGVRRARC